MWRQGVLDPYALVEGDEAEDVQSKVGGRQQMIALPFRVDEILL